MNRYLQKFLEITLHHFLNLSYQYKYPSLLHPNKLKLVSSPQVSIVVPIYRPKISWLKTCLDSVINQSYQNWELILVDDNSNDLKITELLDSYSPNPKIKIIVNSKNLNIVKATNRGLRKCRGDWIAFLDHDDYLWPEALSESVFTINQNPQSRLIYTDQDKINDSNHHFDPFLKPDYNFNLLRQTNYINHLTLIHQSTLKKLNYLREGTDLAQDWDLLLRVTNLLSSENIVHLPKILYSWRLSSASTASSEGIKRQQSTISKIQQNILQYDLNARKITGNIGQSRYLGIWSTNNQKTILPYQFYFQSLIRLYKQ